MLFLLMGKLYVLLNVEKQMMPRKKEMGSTQKRDSILSQNEDRKLDVLLGISIKSWIWSKDI